MPLVRMSGLDPKEKPGFLTLFDLTVVILSESGGGTCLSVSEWVALPAEPLRWPWAARLYWHL